MSPFGLILLVVIVVLVCGGGGYWGPSWFGPGTTPSQGWNPTWGGGGLVVVLLILLVLFLTGHLRF